MKTQPTARCRVPLARGAEAGYAGRMLDTVLSITVLAAILLLVGAFFMWRRTGNTKQTLLMVLLAVIALINVAIWTLPDAGGEAPLEKIEQGSD